MSYFDPFPTIEAAPSEPPFHYCRFNTAYLGFILGALRDSIDRTEFWDGSTAEIGEMLQKIDLLYLMLMTEATPPVSTQTTFIPAYGWIDDVGEWVRFQTTANYYETLIAQVTPALNNRLRYPVALKAGEYAATVRYQALASGALAGFDLPSATPPKFLFNLFTYNATPLAARLAEHTFTLNDDFEGDLKVTVQDDFTQGGTQNVLRLGDVTITRIGD